MSAHGMGDPADAKLRALMQQSMEPVDTTLRRDLWHDLGARRAAQRERRFRLKWWEWALAAGDLGAAFYAPEAIPALLYHL